MDWIVNVVRVLGYLVRYNFFVGPLFLLGLSAIKANFSNKFIVAKSSHLSEMLWEKEVNGGMYIDLLSDMDSPLNLVRLKRKKKQSKFVCCTDGGERVFQVG